MIEPLDEGLMLVRTVRAKRADVFDAWVNPRRLRAWWGPPGVTVSAVEGELRVGGHFRISMLREGNDRVELVWMFKEISPPDRLVFEWGWATGLREPREKSVVTVAFNEVGDWTQVEVTHVGIVSAGARESHAAGWAGCLDGLEAMLN